MFTYLRDGISVVSMQDTRKPNSKGDFPIKIRVNHKRKREYYTIEISMRKPITITYQQAKRPKVERLNLK